LADAAAAAVVLAFLVFTLRPYLQTARVNPTKGGALVVAGIQEQQGLPLDPSRSYYEQSLHWLAWYLGWPLIVVAVLGAAWLARRAVLDRYPSRPTPWPLVLCMLLGGTALALWKPGITPDHPWADRRFVQVALPAVVLCATAATAAVARAVRHRGIPWAKVGHGARRSVVVVAVLAGVAALVAPAAVASSRLVGGRTEQGELSVVHQVCRSLEPGDVVLMVGNRARNEWTGTLRVLCGVPTAQLWQQIGQEAGVAAIERVAQRIHATGGQLVLLASDPDDLALVPNVAWGEPVAQLATSQDDRTLVSRPTRLVGLSFNVWLARLP
jgi:hypothetical protein